jgi:phosphoglycerol transferase MdoB-like AlkP superfamily enzyme
LPYLPKAIQTLGYQTSFVYGGDIDFANFRSYLTNCGFDHITENEDFPEELDESKWGVHDHHVFQRAFQECDSSANPFFKIILSLSSHEPFDVPMEKAITGTTAEAMFLNSCYYTDKSLGEFIDNAKKQSWWNNTVVLITADHGHRHPGNKELRDKERFRIPLLVLGGALQVRDTVIHTIGNQTDIANTLLAQIDKSRTEFKFSKNLLGVPSQSFSFYFFNDGFGFISPDKYIIHDNPGKQFLRTDGASDEDLIRCKAYQQTLFTDYNKR